VPEEDARVCTGQVGHVEAARCHAFMATRLADEVGKERVRVVEHPLLPAAG
jgi:hypothetical protein